MLQSGVWLAMVILNLNIQKRERERALTQVKVL